MSKKQSFSDPSCYINRELSWVEFNQRVLDEGANAEVPLLERLKFLAIVSSNLDEFFMVRVGGLTQQIAADVRKRDPAGLTPRQQLRAILSRVHQLCDDQTREIAAALQDMRDESMCLLAPSEWTKRQQLFIKDYFYQQVHSLLTPLNLSDLDPAPLLPGLQLHVLAGLQPVDQDDAEVTYVAVALPTNLPRFILLPDEKGIQWACMEDIVAAHFSSLFSNQQVRTTAFFRITRDADVTVQDDAGDDLLDTVEQAILDRRRRRPVRLELSHGADRNLRRWLIKWLDLETANVFDTEGPLDARFLMDLAGVDGMAHLRYPVWTPQPPRDLADQDDLWQAILDKDILLFHPYEQFDPIIDLMQQAADDPDVLAIKQTLYRTSGDSPIIAALERAARSGKQVTVLVELKARFDEYRNIQWARRLEDAGCLVIYGVAGYKTHSKAMMIIRRESGRIRRYVHLGTGNYNDKTARLYSDTGLLTSDKSIAADVASFFNLLTGYSETVGWSELAIAPTDMCDRFIEMIEREVQTGTTEQPGLIRAKVNSLQDTRIIKALYRASCAGVQIQLNVRGICCLRPGVKGVSENICVTSILDRYLEHARIFHFRNAGHDELYMSSADWMTRNLSKRLEILFPVKNPTLSRRLLGYLDAFFADNVKAQELGPDGLYQRVVNDQTPLRAQELFYQQAVQAAQAVTNEEIRFQPLQRKND